MHFDFLKDKAENMFACLLRNFSILYSKRGKYNAEMGLEESVAELKLMIDAFPEPSNDYDRCYQQYQCIVRKGSKVKFFCLHCAGVVMIPFFLALYALNRLLLKPSASHSAIRINFNDKFGNVWDYSALMPRELMEEFPDLKEIRQRLYLPLFDGALGMDALKVWLGMAIRHPLKGHLNFNLLVHIMFVNRLLLLYHPKALIVARMEMRYASNMMTMLCERHGCELILLMHGELTLDVRTAFVRFSRMYIWDEHYRDIMLWGRSDATRYIVAKPDSVNKITANILAHSSCLYDICYYMTGNNAEYHDNLEVIRDALVTLAKTGLRIKIRPHPRWSDMEAVQTLFGGFDIERASEKSLDDSVAETRCALGMFSTVLVQAFYAGKTVVLDDVSNPAYFSKLEEWQYIMLKKPHLLLSELLRRNQQTQEGVCDEHAIQ